MKRVLALLLLTTCMLTTDTFAFDKQRRYLEAQLQVGSFRPVVDGVYALLSQPEYKDSVIGWTKEKSQTTGYPWMRYLWIRCALLTNGLVSDELLVQSYLCRAGAMADAACARNSNAEFSIIAHIDAKIKQKIKGVPPHRLETALSTAEGMIGELRKNSTQNTYLPNWVACCQPGGMWEPAISFNPYELVEKKESEFLYGNDAQIKRNAALKEAVNKLRLEVAEERGRLSAGWFSNGTQ